MTRAHSGGGVGPLQLLDVATATSEAQAAVYNLDSPCTKFSLQVMSSGSTGTTVILQGGLSPDSTGLITLLTWSSDTDGVTVGGVSTGPISLVTAVLDGLSSSGGVSAWFSATP